MTRKRNPRSHGQQSITICGVSANSRLIFLHCLPSWLTSVTTKLGILVRQFSRGQVPETFYFVVSVGNSVMFYSKKVCNDNFVLDLNFLKKRQLCLTMFGKSELHFVSTPFL